MSRHKKRAILPAISLKGRSSKDNALFAGFTSFIHFALIIAERRLACKHFFVEWEKFVHFAHAIHAIDAYIWTQNVLYYIYNNVWFQRT